MKITVIGAGFVGQATGRGLRKHGHDIKFVDLNTELIQKLKKDGFSAVDATSYSKIDSDVTMICVNTPSREGKIILTPIKAAVTAFAERLKKHNKYHVLVIRSTVPPGTTREVVLPLIEMISNKKAGKGFGVCMQPEYLREVTANEDFERPWTILIGEHDTKSGDVLVKIFKSFDAPIERCNLDEAEFQKYVHNLFNAAKITFFNEMRIIGNKLKLDVDKVFHATAESCEGLWNPLYGLRDYGPFDGSCLPKDSIAFIEWAKKNYYDATVLEAVVKANKEHENLLGKNRNVRNHELSTVGSPN